MLVHIGSVVVVVVVVEFMRERLSALRLLATPNGPDPWAMPQECLGLGTHPRALTLKLSTSGLDAPQ